MVAVDATAVHAPEVIWRPSVSQFSGRPQDTADSGRAQMRMERRLGRERQLGLLGVTTNDGGLSIFLLWFYRCHHSTKHDTTIASKA